METCEKVRRVAVSQTALHEADSFTFVPILLGALPQWLWLPLRLVVLGVRIAGDIKDLSKKDGNLGCLNENVRAM